MTQKPDLQFMNCGSFASCWPETERGREWLAFNILNYEGAEPECPDLIWPVHIEFRYLEDIVNGARSDGLVCHG